jgi:hypothetical protein
LAVLRQSHLTQAAKANAKGLREIAQAIVKQAKSQSASAVFTQLANAPQAAQTATQGRTPEKKKMPNAGTKCCCNELFWLMRKRRAALYKTTYETYYQVFSSEVHR